MSGVGGGGGDVSAGGGAVENDRGAIGGGASDHVMLGIARRERATAAGIGEGVGAIDGGGTGDAAGGIDGGTMATGGA
jgi:hypothetical protein